MPDNEVLDYPAVCPYLVIQNAASAMTFYKDVFGATERMRLDGPDGTIYHAEIAFGESVIMLADEFPDMGFLSPQSIGGSAVSLMVYVDDCDALYDRAIAAGATSQQEPNDQVYGDRTCRVQDPFGHVWSFGVQKERLTVAEIRSRMADMLGGEQPGD